MGLFWGPDERSKDSPEVTTNKALTDNFFIAILIPDCFSLIKGFKTESIRKLSNFNFQ